MSLSFYPLQDMDYQPFSPLLTSHNDNGNSVINEGPSCNQGKATERRGDGSTCIAFGGQSVNHDGNCKLTSWSGNDCRGSSQRLKSGCTTVTFGSIQVSC